MQQASKTLMTWVAGGSGLITLLSLAGGGGGGAIGIGIVAFIAGSIYLIPSFAALERQHDNSTAIIALNVLLGWILLPWIGALIWALSRNRAVELMQANSRSSTESARPLTSAISEQERTCPFCAETIKAAAKICKHCRSELPELQPTPAKPATASQGKCPNCESVISLESKNCPHCKSIFGEGSSWKVTPI